MRVAVDVTPLLGQRTGVGVMVAGLVEALAGHPDHQVAPYVSSWRARRTHRRGGQPDALAAAAHLPLPARLAPWGWRLGWPKIERAVGPIDVAHGTNFLVPPSASALRVVTVHDLTYLERNWSSPSVRAYDRHLRVALRQGAVAHCLSEAVAAAVRDRYATERVGVVPPVFAPLPDTTSAAALLAPVAVERSGEPLILVLGTTTARKRVPDAVAAFGQLAAAAPGHLAVVGPAGNDEAAVRAAIDRLPDAAQARVSRHSWVEEPTKRQLLTEASVLLTASEAEGFGFPVLEAMAAGVPVVATEALAQVAGDAALTVPARDVAALGAALVTAACNDSERRRLVEAGYARAAQFNPERCTAQVLALYERFA